MGINKDQFGAESLINKKTNNLKKLLDELNSYLADPKKCK